MAFCIGSARVSRQAARYIDILVPQPLPVLLAIPIFLCPGIRRFASGLQAPRSLLAPRCLQRRLLNLKTKNTAKSLQNLASHGLRKLPEQCAGCGALSQTVDMEQPGFYSLTRRSVREFIEQQSDLRTFVEEEVINASLQSLDGEILEALGGSEKPNLSIQNHEPPICDRCHALKHHDLGVSIHHPSIQSIQDTVFESPYKYNHIYHVIDAADFPMSLIPGLHRLLHITPQRTLNRRSRTGKFYHGRQTEVSFIITRSDLLAPLKIQVDSMMPYLVSVLRDALGRSAKDVRLGNVRCVSAIRGWWTKQLKEDIWARGGGNWMVGKVNVGKSQLFQDVFPKGRGRQAGGKPHSTVGLDQNALLGPESLVVANTLKGQQQTRSAKSEVENSAAKPLESFSLLPPARPETEYPSMPLVSALPGTTASPIRVPFGNGKGELIDLPGLSRGDLEFHVQEEHRKSLVMRSRVRPEQKVIKPGQSLLVGGFIRITPLTPDVIILAYAFTPIGSHLTATEKAIGTQTQTRESGLLNIALPGVGQKIASAGTFYLKWDVTRQRTGPVTAEDAAGIKVGTLPYRVLSIDILIEGCGWIELVTQVRKKPGDMFAARDELSQKEDWFNHVPETEGKVDPQWPAVEVFTPDGRFISSRRPMNAWLYANKPATSKAKSRPRQSMKGRKKAAKITKRMTASI